MNHEARCAYIVAMAACVNAEVAGMQAENAARAAAGLSQAYTEAAFQEVISRYGIHHNAVIEYLRN